MKDVIVGIDIGTSKVCTVIGRVDKTGHLEVLGRGLSPCGGIKKGIIVDIENTAASIKASIEQAEYAAGVKVGSAYINIVGMHVDVMHNRCSIQIPNEDREITKKDIERVLHMVGNIEVPEDKQMIDVIPRQYIIDGYDEIIDPVGMVGTKLDVEADVVTGKITSVQNIVKSTERAGIKIDGLVVEAFATSELALTPDEKDIGVILIDVGAGVADLSVFQNKRLVYYDSVPVGGDHITNDISIGLRISYAEAEKIKRQYELALTSLIVNDQEVSVFDIHENRKKNVKVSEIVEIIEARAHEIFSLCKGSIDKAGIPSKFGGGVVLTGGGVSYIDGSKQLAEEIFGLPVRLVASRASEIYKPEFIAASGIIKYVSGMYRGNNFASEVKSKTVSDTKKKKSIFSILSKLFHDLF